MNPTQNGLEDNVELEGSEGMERIAQLQLARIERMMKEEQETGIKHNVSRELQALSGLMKTLMKAKEFDVVHKGNDPLKRRRFERMKRKFTSLMDDTIVQGGDRLMEASIRFLELAEENAVDIKIDAEGEIHLADPEAGSHRTG